jgi:hypothetical protein
MTAQTGLSETLPDILARLRRRVGAEGGPDDLTAQELAKCLDLSWAFAERWRIERDPRLLSALIQECEVDDANVETRSQA